MWIFFVCFSSGSVFGSSEFPLEKAMSLYMNHSTSAEDANRQER